jgi:hypothetical protein
VCPLINFSLSSLSKPQRLKIIEERKQLYKKLDEESRKRPGPNDNDSDPESGDDQDPPYTQGPKSKNPESDEVPEGLASLPLVKKMQNKPDLVEALGWKRCWFICKNALAEEDLEPYRTKEGKVKSTKLMDDLATTPDLLKLGELRDLASSYGFCY